MGKKIPNGLKLASILIWIEAAIMAIGSVIAIVGGATLSSFLGISDLTAMFTTAGVATLIIAVAWFFLGFGVWKMNNYAWGVAFGLTLIATVIGVIGVIGFFVNLLGIAGLGTIGLMSFVSLVVTVIQLFALVDKDSMKACKVKIAGWKGIEIL